MVEKKRFIYNILISFLLLIIVIRKNFQGYFFGDPMDSKLQITIQDHWYKWIIGKNSFLDVGMFFPQKNTLGY